MKNMTLRRILAAAVCAAALFVFTSCGYDAMINGEEGDFYLTKDAEMSQDTKADIEEITTAFEFYMNNADAESVKAYLSPDFEITDDELLRFAESYKDAPITFYDSYYMNNIRPDSVTRRFKKSADAAVGVEVTPGSSEMYLALYASEGESISRMVTLLCAKSRGKWDIVWLDQTDYKYNGEDAAALYARGVSCNQAGDILSAYVTGLKLNLVMRPGNALVYSETSDMEDFYYQMTTKFQETFPTPYTPEGMADTVKLHALALANQGGEIIPLVILQTATDLSDDAALKSEAAAVRKALDAKSPGFAGNFPKIAFNAVNQDPTTTESPEVSSFVLE